jgi:hypothetical protein
MTTEARWKSDLTVLIGQIADEEYQRRAWLALGPEVSSPTEMFCQLFDDLDAERFVNHLPQLASCDSLDAIRQLISQMEIIQEADLDPLVLMDDPRWKAVRGYAQRAFERLKAEG